MIGIGTLSLICRKCTRQQEFQGTKELAVEQAKVMGWIARADGAFVCPRCPK